MTTEIVARVAGFDRDDDTQCLTAGFAESPDGSGLGLLFQVSTYEPDEQDVQFGWNTYCIVTGDQSGTCYGGLLQADLVGNELSLLFNPETASELGLETKVKVRLDVDERSIRQFWDAFRQVVLVPWGRADQVPKLSGF